MQTKQGNVAVGSHGVRHAIEFFESCENFVSFCPRMPYTQATLLEILRLGAPVPATARSAKTGCKLGNVCLKRVTAHLASNLFMIEAHVGIIVSEKNCIFRVPCSQ